MTHFYQACLAPESSRLLSEPICQMNNTASSNSLELERDEILAIVMATLLLNFAGLVQLTIILYDTGRSFI